MSRRGARLGVLAALFVALLGAPARADQTIDASVGSSPGGRAMQPGYVGVSLEYRAMHLYTGRDPTAVNPVFIQLMKSLAPGQPPVVRIGGDSSDVTWWPIRGVIPPGGISYALTPGWLRTTQALASALNARLILGVNLAGGRPSIATAEARAFLHGIGANYINALEIGNEPDVYNIFPWSRDRRGHVVYARPHNYGPRSFIAEFSRWREALPTVPLAGPAFAELSWLNWLGRFLTAEPGLNLVTLHRYPLRAGVQDPTSPIYASIPNLMSDKSSAGLAQSIAPYVSRAHARGAVFRLDEMNSASHFGQHGVSDAFASALWALDTLFNLAAVGVDGVNFHSLPGARYELFSFFKHQANWHAFVHPEYYGMMMFAQAFPPGARLLPVSAPSGPVKVWATEDESGTTRVVLINKDPSSSYQVSLHMSGPPGQLERLLAPSLASTSGVTFDGRTYGRDTATGNLRGQAQTGIVTPLLGTYSISLPPGSAALLTT